MRVYDKSIILQSNRTFVVPGTESQVLAPRTEPALSTDRSLTTIASILCSEDGQTEPKIGSIDMDTPQKVGRSLSLPSARSSVGGSVMEPWSPATTVRSTPPIDLERGSPQTPAAMTADSSEDLGIETASDCGLDSDTASPTSGAPKNGLGAKTGKNPLEKALSFLGWGTSRGWGRKEARRVMPKIIAEEQEMSRSVSLRNITSYARDDDPHTSPKSSTSFSSTRAVVHLDKPLAPFEGTGLQARTPASNQDARSLVNVTVSRDVNRLPSYQEAVAHIINKDNPNNPRSLPSPNGAPSPVDDDNHQVKRIEAVVADVEEGGLSARTTALPVVLVKPHGAILGMSKAAGTTVSVVAEPGLVLPCAPSDEEKVGAIDFCSFFTVPHGRWCWRGGGGCTRDAVCVNFWPPMSRLYIAVGITMTNFTQPRLPNMMRPSW